MPQGRGPVTTSETPRGIPRASPRATTPARLQLRTPPVSSDHGIGDRPTENATRTDRIPPRRRGHPTECSVIRSHRSQAERRSDRRRGRELCSCNPSALCRDLCHQFCSDKTARPGSPPRHLFASSGWRDVEGMPRPSLIAAPVRRRGRSNLRHGLPVTSSPWVIDVSAISGQARSSVRRGSRERHLSGLVLATCRRRSAGRCQAAAGA